MNPYKHRIEQSRDGSHTVYSETQGSYFHNPNGAVEESLHVYFQVPGLLNALKEHRTVSVAETGFGTGLNLLLLADQAKKMRSRSKIRFTSVEAFPMAPELASQLNYSGFLSEPELASGMKDVFERLHASEGKEVSFMCGDVEAEVHPCFFKDYRPESFLPFTHVLHDPFDPVVSPELWTREVFTKIKSWCGEEVVMSTFGASTAARAAMASAGWFVARAPGALGKREMTIAALQESRLEGFRLLNHERLRSRFEAGEFNA